MRRPRLRVSGWGVRRWLSPGIGIKRWLVMVFVGELSLALAGGFLLRWIYRDFDVSGPSRTAIWFLTLQFLPYLLRGAIVGSVGIGLFLYGSWRAIRVLVGPFLSSQADQPLVEVIYQKRFLSRGPKIAVIGGGTGLHMLLRGIKEHTSNITAVVTVADDGGSVPGHPGGWRHPELHRRARRRRTAHGGIAPVPLSGGRFGKPWRPRDRQSPPGGHDFGSGG